MKLRNKKTGEILGLGSFIVQNPNHINCESITKYDSLAELNEEWEDYEEPKEYYYLNEYLELDHEMWTGNDFDKRLKTLGNYFETEEEAKKAVEKLKAWKRLKDGEFEFMGCSYGHDKTTDDTGGWIRFRVNHLYDEKYGCEVEKDLNLLFGGEE